MSRQPFVQLFYNPHSGSFSPLRLTRLTDAFRAEGADVILTPSFDDVPDIDARATHICIAGGDGTIRHVASMLLRAGCTLPCTIYPAGTVNLLAREYPEDPVPQRTAASLLRGQAARAHYPVLIGNDMFFACASVGPDSAAVAGLSPALKARIGRAAYAVAFLRLLLRWPRPQLMLHGAGAPIACEAVYIAKGKYYAGPWSFAPNARTTDRLLHVLALRKARRRDFLRFVLLLLFRQDPATAPNMIAFTCSDLSITSDGPAPVQADGDVVADCPTVLHVGEQAIAFC